MEEIWCNFYNLDLHKNRGRTSFIKDGIIDETRWNAIEENSRVLFLLKEAYSKKKETEDWDLRELIREEWKGPKKSAMWWRVAELAYLLINRYSKESNLISGISKDEKKEALLSSAVVNIKKSGGKSSSESENLRKYWDQDKDLIVKQIIQCKPSYIVLGGIKKIVREALDLKNIDEEGYFFTSPIIPGSVVINYWHPGYQVPKHMYFYTLSYHLNLFKQKKVNAVTQTIH